MTQQTDSTPTERKARRRSLATRALRAGAFILLLCGATYAALLAAGPHLVSSGVVRTALERSVSNWTGQRTVIDGVPEIRFWPEPRIVLPSVRILGPASEGHQLLGTIDSLSAEFGIIQAIRGRPAFTDFQLERPVLSVERDPNGRTKWSDGGLLGRALYSAKVNSGRATEAGPGIGSATVVDGSVTFSDVAAGTSLAFTGIGGTLDWENLSGSLSLAATANLDGRPFRIALSSPAALSLLSGNSAGLVLTIDAGGLAARFNGTASFGESHFLSGPLTLDFADVPRFLDWSGWSSERLARWKQATIAGTLVTSGTDLQLGDLKASLNGNNVSGILELALPATEKPRLGGTLAFERVDLEGLLDMFALLPRASSATGAVNWVLRSVDVDVTLSARQAAFGAATIEDMAASLFAVGEKRQFEIVDSRFAGGDLTASLVDAPAGGEGREGQLGLAIRNADLEAAAGQLALQGPLPRARGSLDLSMSFAKPLATLSARDLGGTISLRAGQGTLQPLNLDGVRRLAGRQSFFRLSEAGGGSLAFTGMEFEAAIAGTSARIAKAAIATPQGTLSFRGIVPYAQNSMALAAHWQESDNKSREESLPIRFFVAGSWPDPIISPIAQPEPNVLK